MAKVGKWFTILGLVIMLASVAVGVFFAATGFGKVSDMADNAFVIDTGEVTKRFDAGDEIYLFGHTSGTEVQRPNCRFDGPAPTKSITSNYDTTFTYDGNTVKSYQGVRFTRSGTYTITCDSYTVATPDLTATGILQGVGGVLLATFGGGAGLLLTILGGILWIIGASRRTPPTNYPPAGAAGGYPDYPRPGGYPNYPTSHPGGYYGYPNPGTQPPGTWNR